MADTTPNLALPLLAAAQAQKHVTHNEALVALDALTQLAVLDRDRTDAPTSPAAGDRHLVADGAGGTFAGKDGRVALYDGDAWSFLTPRAGWSAYVVGEGTRLVHDGNGWTDALAAGSFGSAVALRIREAEVALSGAAVTTALVIPARSIVLSVASRVASAVTGATSYAVGTSGEVDLFGGTLGIAAGSSNIGVVGPRALYADTPVVVTAAGGPFTSGMLRLAVTFFSFTAPA
ncbi:DUF2793 domain-containing protein [Ancylobacter sp. 6x-1]|uniref:DUF2793 domain-containing protein n=1 Tax=Ancylobacter crimeensis TaxID=2579147 RepID=A0ABT0D8V3_9HYPH|nr:DUF2793 domain-containing protein [Ancylobacter crimeensis]MCK0196339.1 DUF2793 domain-containing protein [Ancylobacter crimeensis]